MVNETWRILLEDIKKQESGDLGLHKNVTELDITTGYGIYRYAHKNAEIFKYIDEVAKSIGITTSSPNWKSREILTKIQKAMDPEKELYYTYLFYKSYFEAIRLSIFPDELKRYIASLYVNSPKLCAKTLQMTVNQFIYYGYYKRTKIVNGVEEKNYLGQDGVLGPESWGAISDIMILISKDEKLKLEFKYLFLLYAKTYYCNLVGANHSHAVYIRGWNKRIDNLLD